MKRRAFLTTVPGLLGSLSLSGEPVVTSRGNRLREAMRRPVLRRSLFPDPIIIESLELLRYGDNFICRVRSRQGATGISVGNNMQLRSLWPIQVLRVQPFFLGKDARNLDELIEGVYTYRSNYKLQSLALWVPVATVEFAILDLLGKIAGLPIGLLLSTERHHDRIAVYQANNHRGKSAEYSLEKIRETVARTGARAVKFKVGGRMNDEDLPRGRSEALIPAVREAFGPEMTIYADANSGYEVAEAIRIGKLMQAYDYDFFEEPIPFDRYRDLKRVARKLRVPIAGGEQEGSLNNFLWMLEEDALDIVQPDLFYFGGMIRSMRVARMAAVLGRPCVPHISGSGLGYLYMLHFVSALANAGPFHEFKERTRPFDFDCPTSPLVPEDGRILVPSGPGAGVTIGPSFLAKHQVLTA